MSPIPHLDFIIFGIGLVAGIALLAFGALRLKNIADPFKARIDGYVDLPIKGYVDRAMTKVERASQSIRRAPGLIYRAQAARRDSANAFSKITAVLTTPTSLWRLGEVIVTGKTRS